MSLTVLNIGQNYFIKGGSDRYLFTLERLLTERGHHVIPFAARHPDNRTSAWDRYFPQAADFDRPGPLDAVRFVYSRPARRAMEALLSRHDVDIAHLHIYYGKLTASILAPLLRRGIPIVQTLHEFKLVCPVYTLQRDGTECRSCQGGRFWHAAVHACNRGSYLRSTLSALESYVSRTLGAADAVQRFITVSDFVRSRVIEMGVQQDKLITIPSCVSLRGKMPSSAPGQHVLYSGRLEREKGVFTLLQAAAELPRTRFVFAGEGTARGVLEARVRAQGLGNVRIVGFQDTAALEQLIRESICTVLPSECLETFGLTVVESFAWGRPVIASRIGGLTEVVTDGADGLLVEPGNPRDLSQAIESLIQDPDRAARMGVSARRAAETRFSADAFYERLMQVYEEVLGREVRATAQA